MLKTAITLVLAAALAGCCDCKDKALCQGKKAKAAGKDAGPPKEDFSDAGVLATKMGGKPRPVTRFELYGRAGFDRVNVFERPDMESTILGYLRKGGRVRLGNPMYASEGCPGGWFELPEGGFVCQGRGMLVGVRPRGMRNAPPDARTDEIDPYRHGFIRKDWTPAYKRMPKKDEMWSPPREEADAGPDAGPAAAAIIPHTPDGADGGVDYFKYTSRKFKAVRQLLTRGFWISAVNRVFDEETHRFYYQTVRGDFVPGDAVHLVQSPEFQGYQVLGDSPLPAAIVTDKHASFFSERGGRFAGIGPAARLEVFRVFETRDQKGTKFYRIEGKRWLKGTQVEFFDLREPPEGASDKEKWILVDLTRQTLEAYDGTTPAYVTIVSSGVNGDKAEETLTPRGKFHIIFKHVSNEMSGTVGDDETYQVEDVPWTQYVNLNIALHGAFWHSGYGRPRSHGCVNLSPADARWLFNWTGPKLPKGWHGAAATAKNPGTLVIIQGTTPK
jgi:hypothetical protein